MMPCGWSIANLVGLVEDAHHDLFAVHRREDRHSDVDFLLHRLDLEASVLRPAPLRNVEVGEDLYSRHDRVVKRLRRRRAVYELAVDAVPEARGLLHRLEVDVGRLCLEGLDHYGVDHPYDRRLARGVRRRVQSIRARVLAGGHLDVAVVALHDVLHRKGGVRGVFGVLQAGQHVLDLGVYGDKLPEPLAGPPRHLLLRRQVERVGERDRKPPRHLGDGQRLDASPLLYLLAAEQVLARRERRGNGERGNLQAVSRREHELHRVRDLPNLVY